MGYDISLRKFSPDGDELLISLEEWRAAVEQTEGVRLVEGDWEARHPESGVGFEPTIMRGEVVRRGRFSSGRLTELESLTRVARLELSIDEHPEPSFSVLSLHAREMQAVYWNCPAGFPPLETLHELSGVSGFCCGYAASQEDGTG
ncbi:MAG: hypothetical protein AB7S38_18290 [Vulcanimicrobiota bacterium]